MNRAMLKKGLEAGSSQQDPIDPTCDETVAPSPKRIPGMNRAASTAHVPQSSSTPRRKRKAPEDGSSPPTEKRLRAHRSHAPLAFHNVHDRALSQRFYVLERTPSGTDECPEEIFKMTGSTGNIYTVHIKQQPTCDCPHALKGNQCKHVIYVRVEAVQLFFFFSFGILYHGVADCFPDSFQGASGPVRTCLSARAPEH